MRVSVEELKRVIESLPNIEEWAHDFTEKTIAYYDEKGNFDPNKNAHLGFHKSPSGTEWHLDVIALSRLKSAR